MSLHLLKRRILETAAMFCLAVLIAFHAVGTALILMAIRQFWIAAMLFSRDVRRLTEGGQ
jgi:hypothetical protein